MLEHTASTLEKSGASALRMAMEAHGTRVFTLLVQAFCSGRLASCPGDRPSTDSTFSAALTASRRPCG